MKVLIIEDSEDFRSKMRSLLEILDYEVLEASDGLEGIDLIKSESDIGKLSVTKINRRPWASPKRSHQYDQAYY